MTLPSTRLGLVGMLFASAGILSIVLLMEHAGGLVPCPLCYQQRYIYYAALPLIVVGLARPVWARWLLCLLAAGFLANAGFGFWHMGIEYGWWPGPPSCQSAWQLPQTTQDLMQAAATQRPVDCAQAAWRLLGVSLAGYNMLASFGLSLWALMAVYGKTDGKKNAKTPA